MKRISRDDLGYTLNYKSTDVNEYFSENTFNIHQISAAILKRRYFSTLRTKSSLILAIASITQLLITVLWHIFLYINSWSNKRGGGEVIVKHIDDQRSDGLYIPTWALNMTALVSSLSSPPISRHIIAKNQSLSFYHLAIHGIIYLQQ